MSVSVSTLQWTRGLFDRLYFAIRKNPFGMTRDEAKKAYFRFRNKGEEEKSASDSPHDPEQQIERIMRCVEDTNQRLGRIEEDLETLKQQMGLILKKL